MGISRERAEEIAGLVRTSFARSKGPGDWIKRLVEEFGIEEKNAEVFACGWFAGRYAGASDVFKAVQREMDKIEDEGTYPPMDGYA